MATTNVIRLPESRPARSHYNAIIDADQRLRGVLDLRFQLLAQTSQEIVDDLAGAAAAISLATALICRAYKRERVPGGAAASARRHPGDRDTGHAFRNQ